MTSRLEKVGSIFARTSALLRKGVMPSSEKPIWHDLYVLHPPYEEPRYDRQAPLGDVKSIFYEEDVVRAKFHRKLERFEAVNLLDRSGETETKRFINLYKEYAAQGALDDEQIIEVAMQQLNPSQVTEEQLEDEFDGDIGDIQNTSDIGLANSFADATANTKSHPTAEQLKKKSVPNVRNLFSD